MQSLLLLRLALKLFVNATHLYAGKTYALALCSYLQVLLVVQTSQEANQVFLMLLLEVAPALVSEPEPLGFQLLLILQSR